MKGKEKKKEKEKKKVIMCESKGVEDHVKKGGQRL
jgi:hypothetical protein